MAEPSRPARRGVLMVCLGNTCRSPIAEAVLRDEIERRKLNNQWFVDSAGTRGYHIGKAPNIRGRQVLDRHGVKHSHVARVITRDDFYRFDFIIGMDEYNVRDIEKFSPSDSKSKIELFSQYDPIDKRSFYDPYCDVDSEGFYDCFERSVRCANFFLDKHSKCDA